jgi:hypothetical protein
VAAAGTSGKTRDRVWHISRGGSHRDNFDESLETTSANCVTVVGSFLGYSFLNIYDFQKENHTQGMD